MASGTSGGKFSIYNVAFNAEGVPTLTDTGYTVSPGGGNLYDLTWDAAGNVYAGNAGSEYVKGFAVPRADNAFATKAASKYNFTVDTATGVETIGADNAPLEYYNLQGVKVENPENGIFIKKQGNKAVKVIL